MASLTHAPHLADGDDLARRYRRDVNLFASACDDSINSLAALRDLVPQGESVFVLQVPAICVPDGLVRLLDCVVHRWNGWVWFMILFYGN